MSEKTWPALQSCKRRCYDEANDSVVRDRLSQLSDDLLMLIMSSLTMKEVTKTSALSHRWKNLCRFLPVLLFEAHSPILKWVMGECKLKSTYNMNLKDHEWFILRHRPGFTRWVNYTLEAHLAPTIDELRVVFDLDRKFATMNLISISGELNIRDASFLSELTIGNGLYIGEVVAPACDSFSKYFSQLKYLSWSLIVNQSYTVSKFNLGIDNPRSMKNLTHLRISVKSNHDESLLGWAHLIEASPLLQKLHVKFCKCLGFYYTSQRSIVKHRGRPLMSLKTLQIGGFQGQPIDIEFATHVVENSVMLKR